MRRNLPSLPFVALFLCFAFAVTAGLLILHGSDDQAKHVTVLGKRIQLTAAETTGHEVFAEHCAACHQLAASHSTGQVGPDLDKIQPSYSKVLNTVNNGAIGSYGDMSSGLATGPQLYAVARYVSHVADRKAYKP
jgi:mono/diheme cytochrome c family protein